MDITEGHIIPPNCCNSQNTENETDDSASHDSHDRLHDVRKSECETVVTDESDCEDVGETLANRNEEKEVCEHPLDFRGHTRKTFQRFCFKCSNVI